MYIPVYLYICLFFLHVIYADMYGQTNASNPFLHTELFIHTLHISIFPLGVHTYRENIDKKCAHIYAYKMFNNLEITLTWI